MILIHLTEVSQKQFALILSIMASPHLVGKFHLLNILHFYNGYLYYLVNMETRVYFQKILLFLLMPCRLPYFLANCNSIENVHSYYNPCTETFSV